MKVLFKKYLIYLVFIQALIATLGSLFFSEILKWTPCVLCWYQRILMYPLVLITGVSILKKDKNVINYIFPLSVLGFCIALYHVLLQVGIIPEVAAPCQAGISCLTKFKPFFGFITIPMLSLTAFTVINVATYIYYHLNRKA